MKERKKTVNAMKTNKNAMTMLPPKNMVAQ
jgi:hypothetical protein